MSLKLIGVVAAVAGLLAAFIFLYELGYEAGVDSNKAVVSATIDKQREEYDKKLKARLKQMQINYKESLLLYRQYEADRAAKAIATAKLELEAEDKANEITNRIQQVVQTGNCNSVSPDTYRVYRDTRRIVSDPRTTAGNTTDKNPYTLN